MLNNQGEQIKYPPNIQKQLGWLFFFLAWPVLSIGVNITFFIFMFILYNLYALKRFGSPIKINDFADKTIFFFIVWALFCSISQPYFPRNPGFFNDFKFNIQHVYWMVLFLFIKNNFEKINFIVIGKYAFWGSVLLIFFFFLFQVQFNFGIGNFTSKMGRNSFVYQLECLVPIIMFFLINKSFRFNLIVLSIYFLITLLTNGRAGTLIMFLYLLVFLIINQVVNFKGSLLIGSIIFFLFSFGLINSKGIGVALANTVRPFNDRIANLILQEDDGDLDFDRSWIERQIHITKGLEIFELYPIKGIGLNHFVYFDSDYSTINLDDYESNGSIRLNESTLEDLNSRSAHNSYIQILAETGFIGLGLYLLFLLPILFFSLYYFSKFELSNSDLLLCGVILVSIHNWAISSYSSAITFALFGLGYGRLIELKRKFKL
jgi:O-antigen ligase